MNLLYRLFRSCGKKALAVFLFLCNLNAQAQFKPAELTLAGEKYYVYPFRIDTWSEDIPPCGYNLPNGKYLAFMSYRFKVIKGTDKRKLIIKDTNLIRALFVIESNKPAGDAFFYSNLRLTSGKKKVSKGWFVRGKFTDGVKDGEWTWKQDGKNYYENYKNGLKHGLFTTWAGRGKATYNTCYLEGKEVGYFKTYNEKGKLTEVHYYDTLHIRDSSFYYEDGKLTSVYDQLTDPPSRSKKGIWWQVLVNERLVSNSELPSFTYYREYDEAGKIYSNAQLKYPDSYYFDSILSNNRWISVKQIGCPDGNIHDTCYEVKKRSTSNNSSNFDYYRNLELYKSIDAILYFDGVRDTFIEQFLHADTLHNWQFQPTNILSSRTYTYTTYQLPAANYTYVKEERGGITRLLPRNSFYTWSRLYGLKGKNEKNEEPGLFRMPTLIDSANNRVYFVDTTFDKKLGIKLITGTQMNPAHNRAGIIYDDIDRYTYTPNGDVRLLDDDLYNPIKGIYFYNSYEICSDNLLYIGSRANRTYSPEQVFKNNAPYSGPIHISEKKKNTYDAKKNVLSLSSAFLNRLYDHNAKGAYKEGLREGTWEYLDYKKTSYTTDFKKVFATRKKSDMYSVVNYSKGKLNGPGDTYEEYTPQIWEEGYFLFGGKSVKYHGSSVNYLDDQLNGLAVFYHPNGKTKCTANYKEDELEGEVLKYNFNGGLIYQAQFNKGKLNGPLITYDYVSLKPAIKANFKMNKLDGTLEMLDQDNRWMELKADTGYLRYKKLYYDKNVLKEEIVLDAGAVYELYPLIMQSENFLSYCPGMPGVIKGRYGASELRKIGARGSDSVNNAGFYGSYKSYYNTGQFYSQGRIEKMRPAGNWEFYDIAGTLINKINFKDSVFTFADTSQKQKILGKLTGYYGDGRIRCEAYVTALDVSYDCNTHADKSAFELILKDNYDYYGKDNCKNGYGLVKQYSESGLLEAQGRLENYMKTGLWKYYDPNGKLNKMGTYVNNLEEGTWLEGDLEGLNYEDAACFDRSNEEDMKKYLENQKKLQMTKSIYKKGDLLETRNFYVNMNRE